MMITKEIAEKIRAHLAADKLDRYITAERDALCDKALSNTRKLEAAINGAFRLKARLAAEKARIEKIAAALDCQPDAVVETAQHAIDCLADADAALAAEKARADDLQTRLDTLHGDHASTLRGLDAERAAREKAEAALAEYVAGMGPCPTCRDTADLQRQAARAAHGRRIWEKVAQAKDEKLSRAIAGARRMRSQRNAEKARADSAAEGAEYWMGEAQKAEAALRLREALLTESRALRDAAEALGRRDHALAEAAREFVKAAQVDGQHAYEVAWKRLLAAIEANK